METNQSVVSEKIENAGTEDQRKIISRLILQRVMQNDSSTFLNRSSRNKLNESFLSEEPEREMSFSYVTSDANDSPYAWNTTIANFGMKWIKNKQEILDLEGNAWVTYSLKTAVSLSSGGSDLELVRLKERARCIVSLTELIEEINEMVPGPIRVMHLNNEQRIERDRQIAHDKATFELKSIVINKKLNSQLRVGGKNRAISRETVAAIPPGRYTIGIDYGSSRRARIKEYVIVVPENLSYYAHIKRIR